MEPLDGSDTADRDQVPILDRSRIRPEELGVNAMANDADVGQAEGNELGVGVKTRSSQ